MTCLGEHISDTYTTETDTTELENLNPNIIDTFMIETNRVGFDHFVSLLELVGSLSRYLPTSSGKFV